MATERIYNDPIGGAPSSIGEQFRTDYYNKSALREAAREQYFSQLADVTSMPKNMGKKIKRYHYLPLLDDANINDQGIDAAGVSLANELTIKVAGLDGGDVPGAGRTAYFVGNGVSAAAALTAAHVLVVEWATRPTNSGGLALSPVAGTSAVQYAEISTTGGASAFDLGYRFSNDLVANAVEGAGNLYGSSKDVGYISSKMPALSETGGRVNRVGFKRIELEGNIEKFGFFDEYTQESMDFDTDSDLQMHITREAVMAANEMNEDAIQIDLLNGAGVIRYGGDAVSTLTINGETGTESLATYEDLMRLSIDLDDNRTPKNTKRITGTRLVDTKTIYNARYMYVGNELIPMLRRMTDLHGNEAFIPVHKYAAAGETAVGEIGSIDQFRIIAVPEMQHWEGAGAVVSNNAGYRESGGNYNVYPMLVVGDASFTTIGFQTDGKTVKFTITHKKPGKEIADRQNPFGEVGFYSIKWYYGLMILRSERIALIKCVAEF